MNIRIGFRLVRQTLHEWHQDKIPLLAAALAYYMIFSLAPILLIAISVAGVFFGEEAAKGEVIEQIQGLVGREGASIIQVMLKNAHDPRSGGGVATIFGIIILLIGASGVFGQLQDALNTIWEVKLKPGQAVQSFFQDRLLSFLMVVFVGFLLLTSLLLSTALTGISTFLEGLNTRFEIAKFFNLGISLCMQTILFASIYKVLPDVKVPWKNLWIGAGITALLFTIGQYLIGLYLIKSSAGSAYGAAGSLVIILIWVFCSAQILLLGAEFTQVYSKYCGSSIQPSKYAMRFPRKSVNSGITVRSQSLNHPKQ
jgi:membrane protein